MDTVVWIVLIIAVAVVVVVLLLRERLSKFFFGGNVMTGKVEMHAEAKDHSAQAGVQVTGNKSGGDMKVRAQGGGTQVVDNDSKKNMDIEAKNDPK